MQDKMLEIFHYLTSHLGDIVPILEGWLKNGLKSIPYAVKWIYVNGIDLGEMYCHAVRWVMPILALMILFSVIRSLIRVNNPQETWGYLIHPELGEYPITHWETLIGRGKTCDISMEFMTVSKVHCALIFDGIRKWRVHNLSGKGNILVNGREIQTSEEIETGDKLSIGGVSFEFEMISEEENALRERVRKRASSFASSPIFSIVALTIFQILTVSSLIINRPEHSTTIALSFIVFSGIMWSYVLVNYLSGKKGFEPEILAFFLCSLCLAVTASSNPEGIIKQLIAIIMGMAAFIALCWYLRDLKRVVKIRHIVAGLTCLLLASSIVLGTVTHGASNWIYIGGLSIQPSELAKVCFIFAGAASLERLFVKRNLWGFMGLSFFCFGALALMSDFGTAAIFFVTFLVIAFLRSGDFATLSLIIFSALAAMLLAMKFKPYIAARFSVWGHAWENVSGAGYQQVRTMSAAASGGLIGVGSGEGWLHNVAAANTDLVFGMICEEWGLIIALLAVLSIASLSFFIVRVVKQGRSSYYVISACAAASLLVFQTMLNVFGSVDLFPLTGVTFPFVSCGGSSMLASWALLAFIKAADTRQGASFAVKKIKLKSMWQGSGGPVGVEAEDGWDGKFDPDEPVINPQVALTRDIEPGSRPAGDYSTSADTYSFDDVTGLLNKETKGGRK